MHGCQRSAKGDANVNHGGWRHGPIGSQLFRERTSVDELHPHADSAFNALRAVHGDDIRMTDFRQQSAFVNGFGFDGVAISTSLQELQSDNSIEPSVVRAIHV